MPYGVSNSFKRGTIKTYSRQARRINTYDDVDLPRKRVRMDSTGNAVEEPTAPPAAVQASCSTNPSSPPPSDLVLLSSNATRDETVTPPSSPPPRTPSPIAKTYKPAFSFLKRKRDTSDEAITSKALTETTDNKRKAPLARPGKKARLIQMQIDLGGETRKACKGCGMDYIPSNAEDAALHREFHTMNLGGVAIGKACLGDMLGSGRKLMDVVTSGRIEEVVFIVDRRASLAIKNKAKKVLDVVNRELSAVDIEDEMLWGQGKTTITKKQVPKRGRTGTEEGSDEKEDRFKIFLYLSGDKCIGLCLAERIHNAFEVLAGQSLPSQESSQAAARSSSISIDTTEHSALLGISRIWTSKSHRRKGIAAVLLDCARSNFFYGIEVPKEMVAFSQPTESGGQLAEWWFGQTKAWHVYAEAE